MANPLELTYYVRTGYNPSDEPASDAVINLNEHWTAPLLLKEYDPSSLQDIKVQLTDDDLHRVDYLRIRDTFTGERWYYYVAGHRRLNEKVVVIRVVQDAFATVGLSNISFFGNIARRSLSAAEKATYPLLPEPWAPRRPLKTRRMIIDLNVNKTIKLPSHISTTFSEDETPIVKTKVINVPNSALGLTTTPDSLSISKSIPMGYPNVAGDTSHTITTPWGTIQYTTPYEQYLTLSGTTLATFLEKAKKYNALDLIEPPYYVPSPGSTQTITISELSNSSIKNPKASRYYTTVTIRSLASNSSHTYSDNDTNLQYSQSLTVVIAPDKNGGIYVIPTTIRDTGLNAYTYLDGVYSPFETVMNNAVGDTPGKFAADGTLLLNEALNELYNTYIYKVNAMQTEGMQAKYFKDLGTVKGLVMSFASELLASTSTTTSTTYGYYQNTNSSTCIPSITQTTNQSQYVPAYSQSQNQSSTTPGYNSTQVSNSNTPTVNSNQTSNSYNPTRTQTQGSYTYTNRDVGCSVTIPTITTNILSHYINTSSTSHQTGYNSTTTTNINTPSITQNMNGNINTPSHTITTNMNSTTSSYTQNTNQRTYVEPQTTNSTTRQNASSRSVSEGNDIAVQGVNTVYEINGVSGASAWSTLQTLIFGGYRNEVHSFMLGNINDYLNRWVSIQNDMHNGKVANLFKNITLVGNYNDYNKLVGKYEILIASLQPEDELNFDLFLEHFGHAVDEYTNTLVSDVRDNYNYTMVGEDAILTNSVQQDANGQILNQFRTGVRVWKTLIRPDNY